MQVGDRAFPDVKSLGDNRVISNDRQADRDSFNKKANWQADPIHSKEISL